MKIPVSAVNHWDQQWQHEEGRRLHLLAEQDVLDIIPILKQRNATRVLDLGCGVGRHSLLLAQHGFEVSAVDLSPSGVEFTRKSSEEKKLEIDCQLAAMDDIPFPDASFDYCLSWNVIYHGDVEELAATIREVSRLLSPGGLFQATLLSKRNRNYCLGREIAADTWINESDAEKAHPHCYRNALEVCKMMSDADMDIWSLYDREHEKPESYHWHLIAEKNN